MKFLQASILLLLLSVQTFYQAGLVGWFYANQDSIARAHCVNKNRPQMHCDGKCYLAKKLKQAEQQEANSPSGNNGNEKSDLTVFVAHKYQFHFLEPDADPVRHGFREIHYLSPGTQNIYHPPRDC